MAVINMDLALWAMPRNENNRGISSKLLSPLKSLESKAAYMVSSIPPLAPLLY